MHTPCSQCLAEAGQKQPCDQQVKAENDWRVYKEATSPRHGHVSDLSSLHPWLPCEFVSYCGPVSLHNRDGAEAHAWLSSHEAAPWPSMRTCNVARSADPWHGAFHIIFEAQTQQAVINWHRVCSMSTLHPGPAAMVYYTETDMRHSGKLSRREVLRDRARCSPSKFTCGACLAFSGLPSGGCIAGC